MSLLGIRPGRVPGHIAVRTDALRLLRWWRDGLAAWLPARWRPVLGLDRGRVLLQVSGGGMAFQLQRADRIEELGTMPLPVADAVDDPLAPLLPARMADLPRWLLLAPGQGLCRRLALPAAAAARLREVAGFEIDRQTPFSADAVAFDARVVGSRGRGEQIDADLVVVPRTVLDPQLAALGPLARSLAGVDLAAADGIPLGINLLPPERRRRQRDPWAGRNLILAALALLGFAGLLWQLLDNRRDAAEALEQAIAGQATAGRQAAVERRQLTTLVEGQAFLDRTRAERPGATEILDELTRRLPDGTYLEKLSLDDRQLMLIGLSAEAAALVGRLQGSPLWHSPALSGALQPDPASGRDRFTLIAELGPAPQAAGAATAPASVSTPAEGADGTTGSRR